MKRGSALLIVLGMLAFMVMSAVGFSIYMRESRVPSSHLRREATARHLLKSALANAMARIDGAYDTAHGRIEGVYDDVYPGVSRENLVDSENGGLWRHRVFTPFGPVDRLNTVSTLTLEGLAYLPPAIINEARAFSRTTRTAMWSNLAYDLGRYAFCAIDVSDCFDINKLYAGERRTSAAGERITLASLYPTGGSALDDLFDKAGEIPFVSLADFNIAAGSTAFTPFYRYIGSSGAKIYTSSDYQSVSNALFITDTWFPATNDYLTADLERRSVATGDTLFDLAQGGENQPFAAFSTKNFLELEQGGKFNMVMRHNLGGVGLACLYDYLDSDSVPISLALPTTEIAPMVCGLSVVGAANGLSPKFDTKEHRKFSYTRKDSKGTPRTVERTITAYQFRGIADFNKVRVAGLVAYPFKRLSASGRKADLPQSYTVEPLVAVFYGDGDLRCRLQNADFRPTADTWNNPDVFTKNTGVCWYRGTSTAITLPSDDIRKTEDAVIPFVARLDAPNDIALPVCYRVDEEEPNPPTGVDSSKLGNLTLVKNQLTYDSLKGNNARLRTFDRNGNENVTAGDNYNTKLFEAGDLQTNPNVDQKWNNMPAGDYRFYCAVWVRIADDQGNTVDMVPATFADDQNFLKGCTYPGSVVQNAHVTALCGAGVPLMDCRASSEFNLKYDAETLDKLDGSREVVFDGWKAFYAPDPRYNFAPEDWYGSEDDDVTKTKWLNAVTAIQGEDGRYDRDRDIFMFVSNQEYLQSIGELQFLPFVQRLGRNAEFLDHDFSNVDGYHGRNDFGSRGPGSLGGFANGSRFWTTYSAIADDDDERNPYFDLYENGKPATVISGSGDFRVNPFSPDSRVLAAAILDTPYDYAIASTNDNCNKKADMSIGEASQLAFGENGKLERWEADEVADIENRLRRAFGKAAQDGVTDAREAMSADYLDWESSNPNSLFDIPELNDPLHGVDRKFLYSFWSECFQNRQQLFLVFLRAEPLTVGGSTGDAIANAQLGARGVALVWRDPAPPKTEGEQRKSRSSLSNREAWRRQCEDTGPHRMRVLFYHQFD